MVTINCELFIKINIYKMTTFLIVTDTYTHLITSELYFNCWRQLKHSLAIIMLEEVVKLLGMDIWSESSLSLLTCFNLNHYFM